MDCTRNHSRIWSSWIWAAGIILGLIVPATGHAAFATRFSLTFGEEYNDNIFFEKKKEHDFITAITPTLSLLYAPSGEIEPTANLNLSSSAQIFARHSELNNFGDNVSVNGGYSYRYSPRLTFNLSESLQVMGETRTASGGAVGSAFPATSPPPVGNPLSPNLQNFISSGDQITNFASLQGSYLYRPNVSFAAGYTNSYTKFIDEGGSDVFHTIGISGTYNWQRDHNLHAGYSISIARLRNGDNNIVHNFDIGDDYFSDYKLQLTPTLSVTASTGLSINTSGDGPSLANNSRFTVTKLWETANIAAGVQKGLTPSFGVSGISDTTSVFMNGVLRMSEKFSVNSGVDFSLFDTDDVNFKTFQVTVGLQYLIRTWLTSALNYNFRWIDSGAGATNTDLLTDGTVKANSVFLTLTLHFDLWPNVGLARSIDVSKLAPVLRPPFPITAPPSSSPSVPTP